MEASSNSQERTIGCVPDLRIINARPASREERHDYEENATL